MLASCQGCTDGASAAVWALLWGFVALLLLAAGVTIGILRERRRHETALRQAHEETRRLDTLRTAWLWRTDAAHRLVHWQAPGGPAQAHSALFAAPPLAERLQAGQAFGALRLQLDDAQDGSRNWELNGVPCSDTLGRFSGFAGSARPTDAEAALLGSAAALPPLLQRLGAASLVALDSGRGWRVQQFNGEAAQLWPALQPGAALPDLASVLPGPLCAALSQLPADALEDGGWCLVPLAGLPAGQRGVLLRAAPAVLPAPAATTAESDSFSFTVSHDLRAPIRVVEGFTRIVKEDYGRLLDRVGNDHLDRVLGAAARMNLMIDALLTLARLSSQPLARQPVNLSQLAGYVIDDLRRAGPEREADIAIEAGLTTQGDPTLLRLVLENLLGNAWKYSARCAKAQISLRRVAHGGGSAYVVRDNGAGFDMRSADRLFGLFQRLHSASEFPGHGVGLASVRRIVRRHGGEIWAEAEPGRGAAFFFTLA